MTNMERQELYALMAHWGRDGDILYQKVREWIEGRETIAAEKATKLTALGPCGKHPMACNTFDGLIQGSNGPHRCTVCAELAAVTKERDALKEYNSKFTDCGAMELLATQIANELGAAEMLQGPYLDAVPVIARSLTAYSLALTAAVRREDAAIVDRHSSITAQTISRKGALLNVALAIREHITPEHQSALDAYVAKALEKRIGALDVESLTTILMRHASNWLSMEQVRTIAYEIAATSGADRKKP